MALAEFNGAIAFGGEVDETTHLLAYENTAQNKSFGPNCMLLHVPTDKLSADNLIPTRHAPMFMDDLGAAVPSLMPTTRGGGMFGHVSKGAPQVVRYGAYEIVLASAATDIPAALSKVSQNKRPSVNYPLLEWFDRNRPGHSFVLPCFNNNVEMAAHPILVQYQPTDPSRLFAPGLESHSGEPPTLGGRDHPRDFKVVFGSRRAMAGTEVRYSDLLGDLRKLLPTRVVGFRDENFGTNSDYSVSVEDVRAGVSGWQLFRTMPEHTEGAPQAW